MGAVCDNMIEESDIRSGQHFVESWLIWRQIVLFRQSGGHRSKLIPLSRVTKTPPRGTVIGYMSREMMCTSQAHGLESLSIVPSRTDRERAEYGAQMQFVPILRTNILHEARVTKYQRK